MLDDFACLCKQHTASPEGKLLRGSCHPKVVVAWQIHTDEVNTLQPLLHKLLCDSFSFYTITSSKPGEGRPDEIISTSTGQADLGGLELKTDSSGNTYGQCQQYYVTQALALHAAASPILSQTCKPMLWLEISCATLRVCAAAFFDGHFAFEPLTPALHLYVVNDPAHMMTLARCCSAIRKTFLQLAQLYTGISSQQVLPERSQHSSAALPYYISSLYPDAKAKQIMPPRKLAFLVWPSQSSTSVIVKLVPQGADGFGSGIHAAWAEAGIAPKQVSALNISLSGISVYLACFSSECTCAYRSSVTTYPTNGRQLQWNTCRFLNGSPCLSWRPVGHRSLLITGLSRPCRLLPGVLQKILRAMH